MPRTSITNFVQARIHEWTIFHPSVGAYVHKRVSEEGNLLKTKTYSRDKKILQSIIEVTLSSLYCVIFNITYPILNPIFFLKFMCFKLSAPYVVSQVVSMPPPSEPQEINSRFFIKVQNFEVKE